ncbi:restriction endonuclease [Staphylococcus piscifermentans]|nr:restriction endonuclease [Staphylococcus piscifermentans]
MIKVAIKMENKNIEFHELQSADLIIDAIYEGGNKGNISDDAIGKLMYTGNSGGFRVKNNVEKNPAYLVLYTSGEDVNWPDEINKEKGIVTYFGDNRKAGKQINETKKNGNKYLERIWGVNNEASKLDIPIFMFKKNPTLSSRRSVQFIGLLVPQVIGERNEALLNGIWRTDENGQRFLNYEAKFSILNTGKDVITRKWIDSLITTPLTSDEYAPKAWLRYQKTKSITKSLVLEAPNEIHVRSKDSQLKMENKTDKAMLNILINNFSDNPYHFEYVAVDIVSSMDNSFHFEKTRNIRDGGRDAIGYYSVGINDNKVNIPCILEAKCYQINNSVGVKETSRFISRLKNEEFGVFVTTSFLGKQAYTEIVEDNKKILILTATDIIKILKKKQINTESRLRDYLEEFNNKSS